MTAVIGSDVDLPGGVVSNVDLDRLGGVCCCSLSCKKRQDESLLDYYLNSGIYVLYACGIEYYVLDLSTPDLVNTSLYAIADGALGEDKYRVLELIKSEMKNLDG